ncbi:MAG: hypothetical protein OXE86_09535 [Alphaproteobacteria bacterium]|nr:hypothetical protein [Alphaproteobacteria bacterium]
MTQTRSFTTFMLLVGAVALAVPTWFFVAWIAIFQRKDLNHATRVAEFLSLAPQPIRDTFTITLVALGCSMVGMLMGIVCTGGARGLRKTAAVVETVLGAALALLLLFSLM